MDTSELRDIYSPQYEGTNNLIKQCTGKVKIEYLNYLIGHFTVLWNNQEI